MPGPKPRMKRERGGGGRMVRAVERHGSDHSLSTVIDPTYAAFLDQLDPRGEDSKSESVRLALGISTDNRFREFLRLLSQPRFRRATLDRIAKACDISLREFYEWANSSRNARALAIAFTAIPEITSDMAADARTVMVPCERCDGFGWVYVDGGLPESSIPGGTEPQVVKVLKVEEDGTKRMEDETRRIRACPTCKGACTVPRVGDGHARDKIMEMTGHSGRGKGAVPLQIVQNFGGCGINSSVDQMSKITYDAEPVDEPPLLPAVKPEEAG